MALTVKSNSATGGWRSSPSRESEKLRKDPQLTARCRARLTRVVIAARPPAVPFCYELRAHSPRTRHHEKVKRSPHWKGTKKKGSSSTAAQQCAILATFPDHFSRARGTAECGAHDPKLIGAHENVKFGEGSPPIDTWDTIFVCGRDVKDGAQLGSNKLILHLPNSLNRSTTSFPAQCILRHPPPSRGPSRTSAARSFASIVTLYWFRRQIGLHRCCPISMTSLCATFLSSCQ